MLIPVEGTQYVKDTSTGALLTTNKNLLQENEARKKLAAKINSKNDEINILKSQIQSISSDLNDIKKLLGRLITTK